MPPRKISTDDGMAAVRVWLSSTRSTLGQAELAPETVAVAVRYTLQVLANEHPGSAIEVRVPPYAAVQCGEGPRHTRGTPPNVIEMDAEVWLALAVGQLSWVDAQAQRMLSASGARATLEGFLPVVGE